MNSECRHCSKEDDKKSILSIDSLVSIVLFFFSWVLVKTRAKKKKKKTHLHTDILLLAMCWAVRKHSDSYEKSATSLNQLLLLVFFVFIVDYQVNNIRLIELIYILMISEKSRKVDHVYTYIYMKFIFSPIDRFGTYCFTSSSSSKSSYTYSTISQSEWYNWNYRIRH